MRLVARSHIDGRRERLVAPARVLCISSVKEEAHSLKREDVIGRRCEAIANESHGGAASSGASAWTQAQQRGLLVIGEIERSDVVL